MCRPRPRPAIRPVTPPPRTPRRFRAGRGGRCAAAVPRAALCGAVLCGALGCGKTLTREATQQLLTADSIDRAIAQLDLSPFAGRSVYLETEYLEHKKLDGVGVGGQNYLIGSLRQHLMAAGARLEAKPTAAEFIVEARAGAVGSDAHEVIYGMPENSVLSAASSVVPNSPPLPALPELSFAKRGHEHAATKLRLFAYHRERREIVWQSGNAEADSHASHTWLLGAGPFERGDIYDGARFAGNRLSVVPRWLRRREPDAYSPRAALADYNESRVYGLDAPPAAAPMEPAPPPIAGGGGARLASAEVPAEPDPQAAPEPEPKPSAKSDDGAADGED